ASSVRVKESSERRSSLAEAALTTSKPALRRSACTAPRKPAAASSGPPTPTLSGPSTAMCCPLSQAGAAGSGGAVRREAQPIAARVKRSGRILRCYRDPRLLPKAGGDRCAFVFWPVDAPRRRRYCPTPFSEGDLSMRAAWVSKRRGLPNVTQMYFARQGIVTGEMEHVARRVKLPAELVRS